VLPRSTNGTPVWGYNGIVPGPTIVMRKGRRAVMTYFNRLPPNGDVGNIVLPFPFEEPDKQDFRDSSTVVHHHGMNTDPLSDGYPELTILPGQQFTYTMPNNAYQRPATLWYHDHSVHISAEDVYRGLAGFYLLTDDLEDALPLPKGYGVHDIPLVLQDVIITGTGGNLVYNNDNHFGVAGDVQTVNGVQQPRLAVANRKYRFRMLDAADARDYRVALSDRSEIIMIGSDQGLFERPVPVIGFRIAVAERYEFVIDFARYPIGSRVILENTLAEPDSPVRQLMAFDVVRRASEDSPVPDILRPIERIPRSLAVRERTFEFDRTGGFFTINGRTWNRNRVDADPRVNTAEIWHLVNGGGGWVHPIHIHLVRFLVLGVQGRPLEPYERGWKDMVWLGPNVHAAVIMQFANFRGRFVMHCHNGSHEDHDMMTQFQVV
jgi:spore coat protein A, manganese oxidase